MKRSEEDNGNETVVAIGSAHQSSSKRNRSCFNIDHTDFEETIDSQVKHYNLLILMEVYIHPDTKEEKVVVVASLHGDVGDVKFCIVGNGPGTSIAKIIYEWPEISFGVEQIFEKRIKGGRLPTCHPKF